MPLSYAAWLERGEGEYQREVVVSDRVAPRSDWAAYERQLAAIFQGCSALLSDRGRLTVTFNNLDARAWQALLAGLQQ